MTWLWIPTWVCGAVLVLGLLLVWLGDRSDARTERDTRLRRRLAAAEADLQAARMDVATHKARADGMEARFSASRAGREPIAESTDEVGWLVELQPGGPWAIRVNAATWEIGDARLFDNYEQGRRWIADFTCDWVSHFPQHLMVVVAVDRETREPLAERVEA